MRRILASRSVEADRLQARPYSKTRSPLQHRHEHKHKRNFAVQIRSQIPSSSKATHGTVAAGSSRSATKGKRDHAYACNILCRTLRRCEEETWYRRYLLTPRAEQASQDAPSQAARHLSELKMGAKINGSELSGVYVTHGYQHVEQQQARRQGNTHVLRCTRAHAHGESRF
jgi:hypothetical protein